jgi:hypothetical protein
MIYNLLALFSRKRQSGYFFLAGAVIAVAALTRPSLQLVPVAVVLCLGEAKLLKPVAARQALRWRYLVAFLFIPVLLIGGYGLYNASTTGFFRLALGQGFSMLNYVGHPEIYQNLPPQLARIKTLYEDYKIQHPNSDPVLGWGVMLEPVLEAQRQAGQYYQDWDQAALQVAQQAILSNPGGYLKVWSDVASEYLSSYFVWYGLFESSDITQTAANAQVSPSEYEIVRGLESVWRLIQPFFSLFILIAPPLIVLISSQWAPRYSVQRLMITLLWASYAVSTLATTAIEPSPGQFRYRMPWQGVLLILGGSTVWLLSKLRKELESRNEILSED